MEGIPVESLHGQAGLVIISVSHEAEAFSGSKAQ